MQVVGDIPAALLQPAWNAMHRSHAHDDVCYEQLRPELIAGQQSLTAGASQAQARCQAAGNRAAMTCRRPPSRQHKSSRGKRESHLLQVIVRPHAVEHVRVHGQDVAVGGDARPLHHQGDVAQACMSAQPCHALQGDGLACTCACHPGRREQARCMSLGSLA